MFHCLPYRVLITIKRNNNIHTYKLSFTNGAKLNLKLLHVYSLYCQASGIVILYSYENQQVAMNRENKFERQGQRWPFRFGTKKPI